jgi:spore coat protein JC
MEMGNGADAMGRRVRLMWNYEKRLEFPVNIKEPNAKLAQVIISQYGGPDGEMGASVRYLSQRYAMPYREVSGILTDIGTEELAHLEMVATIVHQLTRNLSMEEIENSGFANYYVDHTVGIWPQAASGMPFSASTLQVTGDVITDLVEDMAAEQKARTTYDNILRLIKEPDVCEPIKFLREREIVHFQRFGEALRITQDKLDSKNFYAFNPAFDTKENCGKQTN